MPTLEDIIVRFREREETISKRLQCKDTPRVPNATEIIATQATVSAPAGIDVDGVIESNAVVQGPRRKHARVEKHYREVEPIETCVPFRDQDRTAYYERLLGAVGRDAGKRVERKHAPEPSPGELARSVLRSGAAIVHGPVYILRRGDGAIVTDETTGEPLVFERRDDARSRCRRNWSVWMVQATYRVVEGADQIIQSPDKSKGASSRVAGKSSHTLRHLVASKRAEEVRVW